MDAEWIPRTIHAEIGACAARTLQQQRSSGVTDVASLLFTIAEDLQKEIDFHDSDVNNWDVANKCASPFQMAKVVLKLFTAFFPTHPQIASHLRRALFADGRRGPAPAERRARRLLHRPALRSMPIGRVGARPAPRPGPRAMVSPQQAAPGAVPPAGLRRSGAPPAGGGRPTAAPGVGS